MANTESLAAIKNWVDTKVVNIIEAALGVDRSNIVDRANLTADLGADSLDVVELILDVEKEFDIVVSQSKIETIGTVGELKEAIIEYLHKGNKTVPDKYMLRMQPNNSMAPDTQITNNKIEQIFKTYPRILEVVKQKSPNNEALQKNINALFKVNLTKKDFAQLGDNYDALRTKISIAYQQTNRGK